MKLFTFITLIFFANYYFSQENITIYGKVIEVETHKALPEVAIQKQNSNYGTTSSTDGKFSFSIPEIKHFSILFKRIGYKSVVKEFDLSEHQDSIFLSVDLQISYKQFDTVSVYSNLKPDTLVGSPKYSIYDFDFYEDKYILLTAERSLEKAQLKLADSQGKIITNYDVPKDGGEAKEFYHDYMGYTNLICKNYIYRINMYHERFVLIPLSIEDVNRYIRPIIDTICNKIIYTDYWKEYPLFNYYSFNEKDSSKTLLYTVEDKDLMHAYNFEYYSLKSKDQLAARRLAMDLKIDKHIAAALMSGFTQSVFYEPLYAPLFVIKDTICVFDHYNNMLYHFDKKGVKLDSVQISYNHPKNWHEWKNKMLKDNKENLIYAVYEKNGHKYIKLINYKTGKEQGKYNLQFYSADKLKIHDGYAYYIYRPYESTQEKFFYRELIKLNTN